jgi:DNA/RNA endonuclease YhcR with UshA esterase domain
MKKISATLLSLFIVTVVTAQTTIKLADVSKHIGDSVTVCGKVAGLRYFENSKNKPTFLNIGANHPNQLLTVVIWETARALFTGKVEDLMDKEICITGRIILYKERPEIVIEKPEQIVIQ